MTRIFRRSSILMIALLTVFGIMFLMNTKQVYAGGDVDLDGIVKGYNSDGTFYSGDKIYVTIADLEAKYGESFMDLYNSKQVNAYFRVSGDSKEYDAILSTDKKEFYWKIQPGWFGKEITFYTSGDNSHYNNNSESFKVSAFINCTVNKSGNATVTGGVTGGKTFQGILIDGAHIVTFDDYCVGKTSMNFTFDVKKYTVGFHTLSVKLSDGTQCNYLYKFVSGIYEKPAIRASWFETEKNLFIMTTNAFDKAKYGDIYFDYKKGKTGAWKTQFGPCGPSSSGKIDKLSPNTTYYIRAYYVKKIDANYIIGPVSSEVAIKTGPAAKPAIKSVKISKAKVKKVWVKPIYNAFGFIIKKGFWTKETTYKVKITFKKRPGAVGIQVYAGGVTLPKFLKGNKKTYTTKFTVGGKAVGKKTAFTIRTKGNATYGAWSPPVTKKKIKIKK